jgi:RimJ/RimL family protein N-acetyltransferase
MGTFGMPEITTRRLVLTRLAAADAAAMVAVLADEKLYEFIGGQPPGLAELRDRYLRLAAGSARPGEAWLNWIVRERETRQPVGTVQATIQLTAQPRARACGQPAARAGPPTAAAEAGQAWTAWVAWVIGAAWQGRGYASESATALVDWLRGQGVTTINAAIHPAHVASAAVARRAGLVLTSAELDGEQVWRRTGR